eukprot:TRINITY_DN1030_c0_g1_i7.p1 TRINITY_DN1030_c0_g1~~TRINITY_DN1030_c0_g1_i7.p1  ORF type:complete len:188 (-),score=77.40 TRINITY_DN1030_c0_g1_i7:49-573(-)
MIASNLLALSLLLLAMGVAASDETVANGRGDCYLSGYTMGESFFYHYSSEFSVEKTVEHGGEAPRTHRAEHFVTADASIQCVHIDDDNTYHFELRVERASWRRPQSVDVRDTAQTQEQIDETFTASLQRPFYYSQRCDSMQLQHVFHPRDESDVTLSIKKNPVLCVDTLSLIHI